MPIADPDRLAQMTDEFRDAKPIQLDELPEDGDYQAIVEEFDSFESKAGDLFLKTIMRIAHDPIYEGWKAWTLHNLTDPERFGWLKKHLTALGADVDALEADFSKLDDVLRAVLDVPVEIAIRTSKNKDSNGNNYRNCYVNGRLGGPITGDLPDQQETFDVAPADDPDESIPF